MSHITLRKAELSDVQSLSERLREDDYNEILASGWEDSQEALEKSFNCSQAINFTAEVDGLPTAMFGTHKKSFLGSESTVWFLGTCDVGKYPIEMFKTSKRVVSAFLLENTTLMNYVDVRYTKTFRWLDALGFEIGEPFPFGINGEHFIKVIKRR